MEEWKAPTAAHPYFPPLSSKPPVPTAFAPLKSKMLMAMPGIPKHRHRVVADRIEEEDEGNNSEQDEASRWVGWQRPQSVGPGPLLCRSAKSGISDAGRSRLGSVAQAERKLQRGPRENSTRDDLVSLPVVDLSGMRGIRRVTESRLSTPATYAHGRPQREFVMANIPHGVQSHALREVKDIAELVLEIAEDSGLAGPADSRGTALARRALLAASERHKGAEAMNRMEASTDM